MIVDAHHHLWNPARGDYGWMAGLAPAAREVLERPYALHDLKPIWDAHGVEKTILVQAAPTVSETEYLLGIADSSDTIAGVIGWIDFEAPESRHVLARLAHHPKFLGVRPMIQNIQDDSWMLRDDVQWAFEAIIAHDLIFEALGFPRHIANFRTLFARHKGMRIVLNHCLKPQIRDHAHDPSALSQWAQGMAALADETDAVCKFSALVTEANADWTPSDLRPFTDHIISVFGPDRLMWGSDWPVCLLASTYARWMETAQSLTADFGQDAQNKIFGETARQFYRMEPS
ncbi:MAG: amidohydrolase family protein [Pseudomonadota bacterium]